MQEKAECEAKEKAECEARERAKQEAQEQYKQDLEFWVKRAKEERQRHEAAAQQVAEVKQLQHQVQMLEASGSGRNRELNVSCPPPTPPYMRLIQNQVA